MMIAAITFGGIASLVGLVAVLVAVVALWMVLAADSPFLTFWFLGDIFAQVLGAILGAIAEALKEMGK